jgi:hypothetical protein
MNVHHSDPTCGLHDDEAGIGSGVAGREYEVVVTKHSPARLKDEKTAQLVVILQCLLFLHHRGPRRREHAASDDPPNLRTAVNALSFLDSDPDVAAAQSRCKSGPHVHRSRRHTLYCTESSPRPQHGNQRQSHTWTTSLRATKLVCQLAQIAANKRGGTSIYTGIHTHTHTHTHTHARTHTHTQVHTRTHAHTHTHTPLKTAKWQRSRERAAVPAGVQSPNSARPSVCDG